MFSSLCSQPFDEAEVRSSLWHLFYVSERFELVEMRQFKQVCHALSPSIFETFFRLFEGGDPGGGRGAAC